MVENIVFEMHEFLTAMEVEKGMDGILRFNWQVFAGQQMVICVMPVGCGLFQEQQFSADLTIAAPLDIEPVRRMV